MHCWCVSSLVLFSLLSLLLQAVDKSLNEAVALCTSQASPLLSAGWGLHFISHASSSALLTTSRALLQCVRVWKAANALAGAVQALCYLRIGCASLAHGHHALIESVRQLPGAAVLPKSLEANVLFLSLPVQLSASCQGWLCMFSFCPGDVCPALLYLELCLASFLNVQSLCLVLTGSAGLSRSASSKGRAVLMSRALNHQRSSFHEQQKQAAGAGSAGARGVDSSSSAAMLAAVKACAKNASILSR